MQPMNEGDLFQPTGTLVEANIFLLVMRDVTEVSWRVEADAARTASGPARLQLRPQNFGVDSWASVRRVVAHCGGGGEDPAPWGIESET